MIRRKISFSTLLAMISTFCAVMTMLISVSNKVVSIKEKSDEEIQTGEYYVLTEIRDNNLEENNNYLMELLDGRIIMIDFDDESA